jgi:DHA1 family inner membrane transport protein
MNPHFEAPSPGRSRAMIRWLLAYGTSAVPQAASPIAFALLTIPLTGRAESGAGLVLTATLAQVIGAVPLVRLGRGLNAVSYLKVLIGIRAVALAAVAVLAEAGAPIHFLLAAAAAGGFTHGAAFGLLRSVLNDLVDPSRLPRALGLAATLSEFTFVAAPIAASVLGSSIGPALGLLLLVALGTAPIILLPAIPRTTAPALTIGGDTLIRPSIVLWLACTMASGAVVSSVEIGAVSIAVNYGLQPAEGAIFAAALCIASVSGGIWVSACNRVPSRSMVPACLLLMSFGAALTASNVGVAATMVGAVTIGCFLAPLGAYYSLQLDASSRPNRKAEVFALSRTANSLGVILTSASLSLTSLKVTMSIAAALISIVTVAVAIVLGKFWNRPAAGG